MEFTFPSWRSYWNFQRHVRRQLCFVRNQESEQFLDALVGTSRDREASLDKGTVLWRSQLGHDWREDRAGDEAIEVHCAYPPARMKPLRDQASEGRANPRGIPCLYFASSKETAIAEVRPWIGSYVSVAQFRVVRPLKIIDCSLDHKRRRIYFKEPEPAERAKAVWADIDRAFAEPMTRSDNSTDYVPTQIIAELFKREGLDGVGYKSSFGGDGFNLALFDLDAAELINCGLYRVDRVKIEASVADNPYFIREFSEESG